MPSAPSIGCGAPDGAPRHFLLDGSAAGTHVHHAPDGLLVFAVHSAAMLIALATAAFVSYTLIGVGFLRRAWLNLDALSIGALVLAAAATLFPR